ncbi:MAG TPA: FAD-binding oxidoreductase [Gaiellaceae bacterium]|nr:FAD-binding oxidoreductase [Gaiellaceae bacterium]
MSIIEKPYALASLTESLAGSVVFPDHPSWDAAREAYNLAVDQRPAAIAFPADAADVQAIVRYAAADGLRVAPQRTGHNASPIESLEGVVLLKTDRLDTVELDPVGLRARVGAGVKWEKVVPLASDMGLAVLHGSTPDVSIAGYGLGGGLGWYGRKHGLFTNSITAIELVTADGRLRRVDHDNEPELFWALRGGGGSFGVVTALEFRMFPISELYAGALFFPWERSAEVLHAWRNWTRTVPDEVTSVGRIMQFPPLDEIPEPLRGNAYAIVHAYSLGTEAEGIERLASLRALDPAIDTVRMVPPVELSEMHMDPPDPLPYFGEHLVMGDLPPKAIDDFAAAAGPGSGSSLISVEIRHVGGALGRGGEGHGALDKLPGEFVYFGIGMASNEAEDAATRQDLHRVTGALRPYRSGSYLNFEEEAADPAAFYGEATYRRLRAVKADVDQDELFLANHPIPPAES